MLLFDSHAHLSSSELLPDIDEVLGRAQDAKIGWVINICTDLMTLREGLILKQRYPWVLNAGATPPHDLESDGNECFDAFSNAAKTGNLVAIGETGLDYYNVKTCRNLQKKFLIKYLQLAVSCHLPVIFHCRDAFADLFSIVDGECGRDIRAVVHCFTGTLEEAKKCVERGWMISLSGILTFKKSETLREIAKWVPLQQLLIETDAPYLAPEFYRGKKNEPSFITETANCLAKLKGMQIEKIAEITSENGLHLFGLKIILNRDL